MIKYLVRAVAVLAAATMYHKGSSDAVLALAERFESWIRRD